jgi:hypothetical protein
MIFLKMFVNSSLQEQALHRELREKREQLEQLMKKNVFRSADWPLASIAAILDAVNLIENGKAHSERAYLQWQQLGSNPSSWLALYWSFSSAFA